MFQYTFTDGVYGLLGPNGAGKSTLMNILTDNLSADSGSVSFNGTDIRTLAERYREKIGFVPQQQQLYPAMTLERFLYYMAALKGLTKAETKRQIDRILPMVNLADVRQKRLGGFSGGMRQRALIAQAVLGDPAVLILDEPTAGLDPKERVRIRNLISQVAFNKIVIIATHIVTDIEMIAKEVVFLREGEICMSGNLQKLCTDALQGNMFYVWVPYENWEEISQKYPVSQVTREGDRVRLKVLSDREPGEEWKEAVPTLEDLYLYLYDREEKKE